MLDRLPNYIKPTMFFSVVLGLILGVLLLVPIVQLFIILAFGLIGGIVAFLLRRSNFIGQFGEKEAVIIGCVTGMASVLAASVSFLPLSIILGAITKTVSPLFFFNASFFTSVFSFFVMIMLVFFLGLMNIMFNIASALFVIWLFNSTDNNKPEEETKDFIVEL